jgi:periplasmic protein TonB
MRRRVEMRLTACLLAAAALHVVVFGVAAAVLSRQTVARPTPASVDIDVVVAPTPDPIADSTSAKAEPPARRPVSVAPKPRSDRRPHEVALAGGATPADPTAMTAATAALGPGAAVIPSTTAAPASAVQAKTPATSGGGVVVSAQPRYRTNLAPDYPTPCKRRREEGTVLLTVVVQTDGSPSGVSLNRSSGYPLLDRSALDAVRRWTFEPGRTGGVPITSTVVVPVRFSLADQP